MRVSNVTQYSNMASKRQRALTVSCQPLSPGCSLNPLEILMTSVEFFLTYVHITHAVYSFNRITSLILVLRRTL